MKTRVTLLLLLSKAAAYNVKQANNVAMPEEKKEPECSVYPPR